MNAIPFLAPWGNRIPGGGFWANGERYTFNTGLHNLSVNAKGVAIPRYVDGVFTLGSDGCKSR